ncbi:MAG: DUF2490 domain-containing protein [Chitinophagales bacterium]|jgi:hypothetical protein|nr:DUF2490 domain-containing protein [Chitinophagales bacterium]
MTKKSIFVLFFVFHFLVANAQSSDFGNWAIIFANKQINSKWNWHGEVQYRNYDIVGDLDQLLLRTGIGYNLTENNNNIHLGYAYILSQPYISETDKDNVSEHRIYQQFITRQTFGRLSIQHRYRFEQRFISSDYRMRFRYFLALNLALNKPMMQDNTLYLSAYNEIFIPTASTFFDRNRLYFGLGYRVSPFIRFELGLLNQLTNTTNRNQLNLISFINF